jgi:hypothetical protein
VVTMCNLGCCCSSDYLPGPLEGALESIIDPAYLYLAKQTESFQEREAFNNILMNMCALSKLSGAVVSLALLIIFSWRPDEAAPGFHVGLRVLPHGGAAPAAVHVLLLPGSGLSPVHMPLLVKSSTCTA